MRTLAWILASIALIFSVFTCASWVNARREARVALVVRNKYAADAEDWRFADELKHRNIRSRIELDEKKLQNDDLEVQIAELQGHGLVQAENARQRDRNALRMDQTVVSLDEDAQSLGVTNPNIDADVERITASMNSLKVYGGIIHRDQQFVWGCAALWLAFGFAAAFASQHPK